MRVPTKPSVSFPIPQSAFRNPQSEICRPLQVDRAHRELSQHVKNSAYVSAGGLAHKGDKTYFDAESYRQFGRRYAEAYLELVVLK